MMDKLMVTYEEYDELCEGVADIGIQRGDWYPSPDIIEEMVSVGIQYFVCLLAWFDEMVPDGMPAGWNECRATISRAMRDNIEFVEERDNVLDKVHIPAMNVRKIRKIMGFFVSGGWMWELKESDVSFLASHMEHSFALCVLALMVSSCRGRLQDAIIGTAEKYFCIEKTEVMVTENEYGRMKMDAKNSRMRNDGWWPDVEEIEKILVPNIGKCFGFIVWLLETGGMPDDPMQARSRRILKKIVNEHVYMEDGGVCPWL